MHARPVSRDLDEQTELGDVYLDGLMRAQLRLSVAVIALTVVGLAALPVTLALVPATRTMTVVGLPFPWLVLGIAVYPAAWFLARWYTRQAERIEQDFAEVVDALVNYTLSIVAVALVCLTTLVVGGFGLRLSRRTSDFYVAGRTVSPRLNASAISGEYLSAASFLGVAGLIYDQGIDMLWLPVGYTLGYLVLLVVVAAPMRRSGAYTLPDFAEARLGSRAIRLVSSLLVVGIGWLYLLPQFQGASLTLTLVTGAPAWVGGFVVMVVIALAVGAGGMRSITFVQAVQYWIKLTALAVPAFVLLALWFRSGSPAPQVDPSWHIPMSPSGPDDHPTYRTASTVLALCLGTMGLPHVLVRYYTNPDGLGARRTTVTVIALLGVFYLLPPIYGALGRVAYPTLPPGVGSDTIVLRLPETLLPGLGGQLLTAMLAGGAFAAFLSTASGLAMSVTGVIDQELLRPRAHPGRRW